MIVPSVVSVLWYIFGISNDVTLPFSVNNVLYTGYLYYILLIYQIFASFSIVTIGSVCYSSYWVLIQHVCSQFSVMIWKIRRAFKTDEGHTRNTWLKVTPQEECNWMIDIIKFYTRITKFVDMINKFYKILYLIAVIIALLLIIFNFLYVSHIFVIDII
ncbi:uncharacterized protein LOC124428947 [Vespa crabro]|uniref:uncharacterized protein LOC124428947 n=1 Tax=Vespa crabro TaxID=7445 RepID=UPI001EFFEE3E|nr:uncharacterized protein LOC124428947 [Vespa crabro]